MSRLSRAVRGSRFYRCVFPRRLPKVLVIGAQKSGTSALYCYLSQHPRFCRAVEKEVDFFSNDLRFQRGLDWYAAQWENQAPAASIRLEASPNYMLVPQAAARIHAHLPGVRLIAILRDPVVRAYSAWRMYRRQLADDPQFYERLYRDRFTPEESAGLIRRGAEEFDDFWLAIQRESRCLERGQRMVNSMLDFGLYAPQLQRFLELFPRNAVLLLDSGDLKARRVETLNRVLQFLGLPAWNWSGADLAGVFVGAPAPPISPRAQRFLRDFYASSNRLVAEFMDPVPGWAKVAASPHNSAA